MAELDLTNIAAASISTPASGVTAVFVDTDKRLKTKDDAGIISVITPNGLQARNIITNSGMNIQQRVLTNSTNITGMTTSTRAGVVADRWTVTTSVASNLSWAQIDTLTSGVETNLLARYYGSIISSTAGKKVMISQFIAGSEISHLRGNKVRLSVKINQKVGSAQVYKLGLLQLTTSGTVDVCPAFLTGAWSTSNSVDPVWGTNLAAISPDSAPTGENGTVTGSYLNITSSAAWVRSSAVFTIPSNAKNLVVVLFSDATGGTTDNISISEFQLTQGVEIVDYIAPPYVLELIRCQKFFNKSFAYSTVPAFALGITTGIYKWGAGVAGAVAGSWGFFYFPVNMWKVPTVTIWSPTTASSNQARQISATAGDCTTTSASEITDKGFSITTTPGATAVIGSILGAHYTAEAEFIT